MTPGIGVPLIGAVARLAGMPLNLAPVIPVLGTFVGMAGLPPVSMHAPNVAPTPAPVIKGVLDWHPDDAEGKA